MSKHHKNKNNQKQQRKSPVFLYVAGSLIVIWLIGGIFLFSYGSQKSAPVPQGTVYAYPESPKQGDTVFVKVTGGDKNVTGSFGDEKLVFYKKNNSSEWISFLGIDADQKPGDYNILVNENGNNLTKKITVSLASFSAKAPIPVKGENGITNTSAVNNIRNLDNPAINKVLTNFTEAPYFSKPFTFPLVSMNNSGFSFGQFIGLGKYALQHLGIDLRAPEYTKIYAVNDGKVVATLDLENYGKTVIIDHGLHIFSMYLHLQKFDVSVGQMVKQDQVIGLSGETGYASGPHLHFSMRVDGTRVDPVAFINATKQIGDNSNLANITGAFLNFFK